MSEPLVTVVVDNYNYAPYLRQAIDSALQQTYPRVEVIVVDDGSTDASCQIIRSYCTRIRSILKPNRGQGSAFNAGFAASRGDLVLFLDADDYYVPTAVEQVVAAARGGAAIVHWRLELVGADGAPLGEYPPPDVRLDEGDVVPRLARTGDFTRMMTSGNAFRRDALERVMPMPEAPYRLAAEGYLLHTVPFLGRVAAIERPLGFYRVHGSNNGTVNAEGHVAAAYVRRRMAFWEREAALARSWAQARGIATRRFELHNSGHLVLRMASWKLDRERHPYPGDHGSLLAAWGVRASLAEETAPPSRRAMLATWFLVVALCGRRRARRLIDMMLVPGAPRPAWMRALVPGSRRRQAGRVGRPQPPQTGSIALHPHPQS